MSSLVCSAGRCEPPDPPFGDVVAAEGTHHVNICGLGVFEPRRTADVTIRSCPCFHCLVLREPHAVARLVASTVVRTSVDVDEAYELRCPVCMAEGEGEVAGASKSSQITGPPPSVGRACRLQRSGPVPANVGARGATASRTRLVGERAQNPE